MTSKNSYRFALARTSDHVTFWGLSKTSLPCWEETQAIGGQFRLQTQIETYSGVGSALHLNYDNYLHFTALVAYMPGLGNLNDAFGSSPTASRHSSTFLESFAMGYSKKE